METLVLPSEDQLARHHYWYTTAYKMEGFQTLTPPPSRRQLTSSFSLHDRNSLSNRSSSKSKDPGTKDAYFFSDLPSPRGVPNGNRSLSPVSKAPSTPVATSASRSEGNLSSLQLYNDDFYWTNSVVKYVERVSRSEKDLKKTNKVSSVRAPFGHKPKGGLMTARSLPEKMSEKLSNTKAMEGFEKKTCIGTIVSNRMVQKAVENIPMEVKILQRPQKREAANLARFQGIPLSEPCLENGSLQGGKAENSGRGSPRLTRRYSGFDKASSFSGDVNLMDATKSGVPLSTANLSSSDSSKYLWASELLAEKWAGPCYTISPPPSSLPFPKFSLQKQESSPLAISEISRNAKHIKMDPEIATQNLKRILHLDFV